MKVHLFGASGSGVTTLGKKLAKKKDISFFDVDDYYWIKKKVPADILRCRTSLNVCWHLGNEKRRGLMMGLSHYLLAISFLLGTELVKLLKLVGEPSFEDYHAGLTRLFIGGILFALMAFGIKFRKESA